MKRSTLALVFLVAAMAVLAVVRVATRSASSVRVRAAAAPLVDRAPDEVRAPAGELPPSSEVGLSAAKHQELAEVAAAEDTRRPAIASPTHPTVPVRVVAGDARAPVAGARVLASPVDLDDGGFDLSDGRAFEALILDASRLVSDANGVVLVPAFHAESTVVTASHADEWGYLVVDPSNRELGSETDRAPLELRLAPDDSLVVQVVDLTGGPLGGIPIELEWSNDNYWNTALDDASDPATGEVRFPHVQLALERYRSPPEADAGRVRVSANVLADRPCARELDADALPADPVLLELERGATLVVLARGPDGTPWMRPGTMTLGLVAEGESRRRSAFTAGDRPSLDAELGKGSARFEFVPAGREFEVSFLADGLNLPTTVYAAGPALAGDVREVVVTLGETHPLLRMRLVSAAGVPIANTDVTVELENALFDFVGGTDSKSATDDAGALLVGLEPGWTSGRVHVSPEDNVVGTVELDREFPNGLTDLGDVTVGDAPILVAGRLIGPAGEVISGAKLTLAVADGDDNWNERWNESTTSEPSGAFEFLGTVDEPRTRLIFEAEGYWSDPREFDAGTSGLVIEMESAGAIEGSLVVDDPIPLEEIQVHVEATGPSARELPWSSRRTDLDEDGGFRCAPLPAGSYDVALEVGWEQPIHEIGRVVVQPGLATALPATDLRGALHVFRFTFVPPSGFEVESGNAHVGRAGAAKLDGNHWFHGPELTLISRERAIDVDVDVDGFRAVRLRGVTGDERVVLERGFPVRVVLVGGGEPLRAPYALSIGLAPVDGEPHHPMDWSAPRFDERREILLHLNEPGQFRVTWIVEKATANAAMATSVPAQPEAIVTLSASDAEQLLEVQFSAEEARRLRALLDD